MFAQPQTEGETKSKKEERHDPVLLFQVGFVNDGKCETSPSNVSGVKQENEVNPEEEANASTLQTTLLLRESVVLVVKEVLHVVCVGLAESRLALHAAEVLSIDFVVPG